MDTPLSTPVAEQPGRSLRVRLPFISTSFATNVWLYALLWPLWWALGIEQVLLPFFVFYEFVRSLIANRWQVRVNMTALIALALALWWVVPIFWVDTQFLDIFLKEAASIWAQFFILVLFWTCIHTKADWFKIVDALTLIAFYTVTASAIYLSGVWRGEFVSVIGRVLPQSMVDASSFFTSIAYRRFGALALPGDVGLFTLRLDAITLSFSALSMLCLLLLPLLYWRMQIARGPARLYYLALIGGVFISLVFTESRIAYLAFLVGVVFYVSLRLHSFRPPNRPLTVALALAGSGLLLMGAVLLLNFILQWFQTTFVDLRPGSWLVRVYVYAQTLALLPQHPIAGWGMSVRLPNVASEYSAGTHSSYLGMLFQHGIIGLLAYLALWLSIWLYVWRGLRQPRLSRHLAWFWCAMAATFLSFNVREVADTWWWDQLLLFTVWLMWGLTMTAGRVLQREKTHE